MQDLLVMLDDLVSHCKPLHEKLAQMTIHEAIKKARLRKNWSMEKLAQEIANKEGLAKPLAWQTIQQWERPDGTAPKRTRLKTVAELLDLSQADLVGLEISEEKAVISATTDDFVLVHRVDVSFSNGHGHLVTREDDLPPLSFRADFLRKLSIPPGKAVVVDAEGDSNYPKIIDGSVVLLNSADTENLNGDFFGFRVDGELLIKRLSVLQGVGILATAENSNFKPKNVVYQDDESFQVIGRAVWTGVEL